MTPPQTQSIKNTFAYQIAKRLFFAFVSGFFFCFSAQSQGLPKEIDSLKNAFLASHKKEIQFKISSKLVDLLDNTNYELSCRAIHQLIGASQKRALSQESHALGYWALMLIHIRHHRYDSAMRYSPNFERVFSVSTEKKLYASQLAHLGLFMHKAQNLTQAEEYYHHALQEAENELDSRVFINTYNGLGLIYKEKNDPKCAIRYYQQALDRAKTDKDTAWIGILNGNIGDIYYKEENYSKALPYYQIDIRYSLKTKELENAAITLARAAMAHLKLGQPDTTKKYCDLALSLLDHNAPIYQEALQDIYQTLMNYYAHLQDFRKAFYYQERYHNIKDSLALLVNHTQLARIQATYDYQLHQSDIELLTEKNRIKQATIERQETLQYLGTLIIVLLVIFTLVLLVNMRNKQKVNNLLVIKNEEINQQKEELQTMYERILQTNEQLGELVRFKDGMTAMIVHDLKNPLNTIIGFSENEQVHQAARQMLNMVLNILDIQKFENSEPRLQIGKYRLSAIVREAINQIQHLSERKHISLQNFTYDKVFVEADYEVVIRVFVNLLTNAIKYTPNNGMIMIMQEFELDWVKILVIDNGKGIPKDKLNLIFDKFTQIEPRSVGDVTSSGVGLAFCKMAIKAHGGKIGVESEINQGAKFWFTLPHLRRQSLENDALTMMKVANQEALHLGEDELKIIKQYLPDFKQFTVYEYSDLKEILATIDTDNQEVKRWKRHLENAIKSCNEEYFTQLTEETWLAAQS